ncbi:uracil-DNA glycosylase [Bradyrhizobium sp. CCBAU 53421]|uniref:uracil-DNA glycosylase n=1 Tax=Bradyrhizobium sp. CCBAU 53421 TaxID=1325120 RepID=UPI00188B7EA2|nr:uracil-DNA glycosylase [Bradyrhizobium sp. CCBAU 53421]QOZ31649.1 uracil-DNA glycosylase [Bradyrhizobium sp. CCBAU 53421]
MKTPKSFAQALAETRLPSVFNPYADCCATYDRADAARIRRRNLVRCLDAALTAHVDTIWIARDLGYRGGRRTGVPLTDEVHLSHAAALMGGIALDRATRGPVVAERTAAIVWSVLTRIGEPAVLWNIFPLHPHEADDPFSNRCHTRAEREATWPLLTALIAMIKPRRIVAIGRDAGMALNGLDTTVEIVRHPSYGGQAEFISGVNHIYGLAAADDDRQTLELPFFPQAARGAAA